MPWPPLTGLLLRFESGAGLYVREILAFRCPQDGATKAGIPGLQGPSGGEV